MRPLLTWATAFSLLSASACTDAVSEGGEGMSESSNEGGGAAAACECISDEPLADNANPPPDPICGESLCLVSATGLGAGFDFSASNDALTCALTALEQRTPGYISWVWYGDPDDGNIIDAGYILIDVDDRAVRRNWYDEGASGGSPKLVSDASYGELPSAQSYADCLAESNEKLRFDCMRMELSVISVCHEGNVSQD